MWSHFSEQDLTLNQVPLPVMYFLISCKKNKCEESITIERAAVSTVGNYLISTDREYYSSIDLEERYFIIVQEKCSSPLIKST